MAGKHLAYLPYCEERLIDRRRPWMPFSATSERLTFGWVAAAATAMMQATVLSAEAIRGSVADLGRRLLMISVLNTCIRESCGS